MVERTPLLDLACHILLILGGLLVCVPIYFAFVVGSHTIRDALAVPPPWLPGDRFLDNAVTVWSDARFRQSLVNSFVVATGIAVGKIAVSMLSAFAITYFRFRCRMPAFWLIFASLMLPLEARILPTYEAMANVASPLHWLAAWSGLTLELNWTLMNSRVGLVLPLVASATATFLFRQLFLTVPEELCEAAHIDGAGPLRFFRSILLPLSLPNMAALAIILFIYGWNQYLWPLLFTDDSLETAMIRLMKLVPPLESEPTWNVAMAAALLVMLPPILVVVLLQRWLMKGLVDAGR